MRTTTHVKWSRVAPGTMAWPLLSQAKEPAGQQGNGHGLVLPPTAASGHSLQAHTALSRTRPLLASSTYNKHLLQVPQCSVQVALWGTHTDELFPPPPQLLPGKEPPGELLSRDNHIPRALPSMEYSCALVLRVQLPPHSAPTCPRATFSAIIKLVVPLHRCELLSST